MKTCSANMHATATRPGANTCGAAVLSQIRGLIIEPSTEYDASDIVPLAASKALHSSGFASTDGTDTPIFIAPGRS